MSKKSRTIIFLTCFFLFALISPLAVFYSLGYRFDFESKKISQTGGLFLKVVPRQVEVYLDEKLNKRTDFFFGSALIENLLPKKYKVQVKKEGYHPWEKTLEIKEKEVTEAKNIILFPKEIDFTLLFGQIEEFWFSPDQKKLVLKEKKSDWALKLYDLNKEVKSHLVDKADFFAQEAELINLDFSEDSQKIYLTIKLKEKIRRFALELNAAKPSLTEIKLPLAPVENALAYQEINNDLYYLDSLGHLFKSKSDSRSFPPSLSLPENSAGKEKLSSKAFPAKEEAEYALRVFQSFVFLQEDKTLYKFDPDSKTFEYFFENAVNLKASPDNRRLAYFSDHEIWLLFLSDKNDPPFKKTGERLFLVRFSEKISDLFWINSNYFIFQTKEKIKISETDERDKINIVDLFETKKLPQNGNSLKIFFNQFDKKLYLLQGESLYAFDPLVF